MKPEKINVKNILYTTDLSDTSLYAFSYAAGLANFYNAAITVLHVMGEFEYDHVKHELAGLLGPDQWRSIQERHVNETRETLSGKNRDNVIVRETLIQYTENVKSDKNVQAFDTDEILVLFGHPVDKVILETAKKRKSDIIVMGMHGHGLLKELIGSTVQKVMRKSGVPVFAVPLKR